MVPTTAQTLVSVRSARPDDRSQLNNLLHFEPYIHHHLDWRLPLEWLGYSPYLVAERKGRLVAALACPPDPPEVAWIRTFATSGSLRPEYAWDLLWQQAHDQLARYSRIDVAAICLDGWMCRLLENSGFTHTYNVTLLSWERRRNFLPAPEFIGKIRKMTRGDLSDVHSIDCVSFGTIWRNSLPSLELALRQSVIATVVEDGSTILGYQISTPGPYGGHLARLAVRLDVQGKGIGYALVHDALTNFRQRGALRVTVNTQEDNIASLALYEKANFKRTNEIYPVYQYAIE